MKFVATKKALTSNFFSPLSFVVAFGSGIRDPGSGVGKNQDPGSKHPGSATLVVRGVGGLCVPGSGGVRGGGGYGHYYGGFNGDR